jgi:nitroimidazol reductase NimA-like FMN-containing flavoprotein (pyridoxamine 5'-phosphate oxidase superfamily)
LGDGDRQRAIGTLMEGTAIAILDGRRIMALSTVRPDGWPQTTIVGYANIGLLLYFVISRSSQKFANLQQDNRVSIAVGEEPSHLGLSQAVYSSAYAVEAVDAAEREQAWRLLTERHPNLQAYALPDQSELAVMRARCEHVSVVDFTRGFGHTEAFDATHPAAT